MLVYSDNELREVLEINYKDNVEALKVDFPSLYA